MDFVSWDDEYIYIYGKGGFNHLEKYQSQWEGLSHILWKNEKNPNHQSGKWSQSNFHGHVSFRQKPKGEDGPCSLLSGCQIEECWVSLMRLEITGIIIRSRKFLECGSCAFPLGMILWNPHQCSLHTKLPKLWWHWNPWGPSFTIIIPPFVSQFSREHMASANVSEPLGTPKPRLDIYMFNFFKKKTLRVPKVLDSIDPRCSCSWTTAISHPVLCYREAW